jgi:hypothetical protein
MSAITAVAKLFFDACEGGRGWDGCREFCTPDASFSTQSEQMGNVPTLRQYADLCAGFLKVCPDASYIVKSFATDESSQTVCVFAVISGTHTGAPRGPIPPTGKKTVTNYVYAMEFGDNKIKHMTKIWNPGWTIKELGWDG